MSDFEFGNTFNTFLSRVLAAYLMGGTIADAGVPYVFGGDHGVLGFWERRNWETGVDCSSGLSIVWHAGGILAQPAAQIALVTQAFELYGVPGEGRWATTWVLDVPAMKLLPQHADLAAKLDAVGETHHCVGDFHGDLRFQRRWWQATHVGGPVGFVDFDPTGFHARHFPGC